MHDLKIGLVQFDITWEDTESNLRFLDDLLESATGLDLIVMPEMFNTGFSMQSQRIAETDDGISTQWMEQTSRKLKTTLCGSIATCEGGKYYNRLKVIQAGETICRYDKHNLFTLAGEEKQYTSGQAQVTFELAGWNIKPLVCYDLRFPLWCFNRQEADLMLFCANWPDARVNHWRTLLRARAIENQCFVAGVNRVGVDGAGLQHSGYSALISPTGEYICEMEKQAGLFIYSINQAEVIQFRNHVKSLQEGKQDFLTC
jgi:predicted amidohydrolase